MITIERSRISSGDEITCRCGGVSFDAIGGRAAPQALKCESAVEVLAREIAKVRDVLYLGRGTSYPLALEGALKLKEISYIHAEGYAAGEMKHGPIALIDQDMPVIVIAPDDGVLAKTISNMQEVAARGGRLILIGGSQLARDLRARPPPPLSCRMSHQNSRRWSMRCRSNCLPIILRYSWARMPTSRAISQKALRWSRSHGAFAGKRRGKFSINSIIIQQAAVPSPCNKASAPTGRSWCAEVSMASRADFAFSSSSAGTRPSAFFWFGQIMYQTLKAMMRPRMVPVMMVKLWTAVLVENTMRPVTTDD